MKAKDLTQADVGKWVTLRAEVTRFDGGSIYPVGIVIPDSGRLWIDLNTILEFTDQPAPVQEVGDVFRNLGSHPAEWTIGFIDGDACLMRYLTGHVSADYPLNPDLWEFVRKGTAS